MGSTDHTGPYPQTDPLQDTGLQQFGYFGRYREAGFRLRTGRNQGIGPRRGCALTGIRG